MYNYFLYEVRKERNTTITPEAWADIVNPILIDWVKTKLPQREFDQKVIDDLTAIRFRTNRTYKLKTDKNTFRIPYNIEGAPKYMYGLNAEFVLGEKTIAGKLLRSDNKVVYKNNPYRTTDESEFVYFEMRGDFIYAISDVNDYDRIILEYYALPDDIYYNRKRSCNYVLEVGSYYDTWNGGSLDVYVDGEMVLSGANDTTVGGNTSYAFSITDRAQITTIYNPGLGGNLYNSYGINDCNGNQVYRASESSQGPSEIKPGELLATGPKGVVSSAGSFQESQNKEIIDMAITEYLERVSDPRIKTQPAVRAQVPK